MNWARCYNTNLLQWGRIVALWLCFFQGLGFSMSLTMVSSNVAGYTKKQVTGAVLFIGYCVGNIIGPQTFIASEARKLPSTLRLPIAHTPAITSPRSMVQY